jgi:hypothetical protein
MPAGNPETVAPVPPPPTVHVIEGIAVLMHTVLLLVPPPDVKTIVELPSTLITPDKVG